MLQLYETPTSVCRPLFVLLDESIARVWIVETKDAWMWKKWLKTINDYEKLHWKSVNWTRLWALFFKALIYGFFFVSLPSYWKAMWTTLKMMPSIRMGWFRFAFSAPNLNISITASNQFKEFTDCPATLLRNFTNPPHPSHPSPSTRKKQQTNRCKV